MPRWAPRPGLGLIAHPLSLGPLTSVPRRPEEFSRVAQGLPWPWRGQRHRPCGLLSAVQELSRAKAMALSERGQAEEELIKAKNQVRLEEVSP